MGNYYSRTKCHICGQRVKSNGLAQFSHRAAHVNRGDLYYVYSVDTNDEVFISPDEWRGMSQEKRETYMRAHHRPQAITRYFNPRTGRSEDWRDWMRDWVVDRSRIGEHPTVRSLSKKYRKTQKEILDAIEDFEDVHLIVGYRTHAGYGAIAHKGDYRVEYYE